MCSLDGLRVTRTRKAIAQQIGRSPRTTEATRQLQYSTRERVRRTRPDSLPPATAVTCGEKHKNLRQRGQQLRVCGAHACPDTGDANPKRTSSASSSKAASLMSACDLPMDIRILDLAPPLQHHHRHRGTLTLALSTCDGGGPRGPCSLAGTRVRLQRERGLYLSPFFPPRHQERKKNRRGLL